MNIVKVTDMRKADEENPGPWDFRDYGQNGYEVMDAMGVSIESGRHGWDDAEDQKRTEIIAVLNTYVAEILGIMNDTGQLSDEFFHRRKGLTPERPIFTPAQAAMVANAYRAIGKPLIAEAISGVRYGKRLLRAMRSVQKLSSVDRVKTVPPFAEFGEALSAGYFTPESIGTTRGHLKELFHEQWNHRVSVSLDIIRSGNFSDERTQYFLLIHGMNLADLELSSFPVEDQQLIKSGIQKYSEASKKDCLVSAQKFIDALRNGADSSHWCTLKYYMVSGRLLPNEVNLSPEEAARLETVMV